MECWTKRLQVFVTPSLAYYEDRIKALRQLEDEGLLWRYRVEAERISARLGDPNHLLVITPTMVEVSMLQPSGDRDRIDRALSATWEAVKPKRVSSSFATFQWLQPLDEDFEAARDYAVAELLGDLAIDDTDGAVLVVGTTPAQRGPVQLEFGIVQASEIPQRLAREVGQMRGAAQPEAPATLWQVEAMPSVAFFCDSYAEVTEAGDTPEGIARRWDETRSEIEQLVLTIVQRLTKEKPHG